MKTAQIAGRLGKPVEVDTTANGTPVASFDLAVSFYNFQTKQKDTEWVAVKTFGTQADFVAQYANPGDVLVVSGDLTWERWESKKYTNEEGAGAKMSKMVVLADRSGIELFSKGNGDNGPRQPTLAEGVQAGEYDDISF